MKCSFVNCERKGKIYLKSVNCWYCKEHFKEVYDFIKSEKGRK
jgi:hypothetical protein